MVFLKIVSQTTATATSNRACSATTACNSTSYQTAAPTRTSNRACRQHSAACNATSYEPTQATATTDRVCAGIQRSCSDIWDQNPSSRGTDGNYRVAKFDMYRTTVATFTGLNCRDQGRTSFSQGQALGRDYDSPQILEAVHWCKCFGGV